MLSLSPGLGLRCGRLWFKQFEQATQLITHAMRVKNRVRFTYFILSRGNGEKDDGRDIARHKLYNMGGKGIVGGTPILNVKPAPRQENIILSNFK